MSEIVLDQTWYLPTYLANKEDPGVTLLTRRYEIRRTPKGNYRLHIETAAPEFESSEAMASAIMTAGWRELPKEADGYPRYVPSEISEALSQYKGSVAE